MADLRLRVNGAVALISFNATEEKTERILRRYARSLGIPTNGTAEENLTAILEHIRDDVSRRAMSVQVRDEKATADAAIEAQAEQDNEI